MKKTYLQPWTAVVSISTASMIAVSGNFVVGGTIIEGVYDDKPIDGGDAWSKRHNSVWDSDWDSDRDSDE